MAAHQIVPSVHWAVLEQPLYVFLLQLVVQVVGDVMLAGGFLSVVGGVGCVVAATRMFGPWAGLWVLAQVGVLEAATVPGPMILVLMCVLWALYCAQEQKGWRTGVWLALAYALADWIWPVGLVVLLFSRSRVAAVVGVVGVMWVIHREGYGLAHPSFDGFTDTDWLQSAWRNLMSNWVVWLGLLASVWGVLRGNRASRILLVLSAVYVLAIPHLVGASEPMLVAQVLIALGVAAVETGPALLVFALVLLGIRLPVVWDGTDGQQDLHAVIQATALNPRSALCSNPAFVRPAVQGGSIRPCKTLDVIQRPANEIYPKHIRETVDAPNGELFAVHEDDILHVYPWLQDLMTKPYPPGFVVEAEANRWRVFLVSP